jgi:hypothetical protein
VTISDLNSFLGGESLVFYLNLSEGALDSGQDLLAYADIYLTDLGTDNTAGGVDAAADIVKKYTLSGDYCSYGVLCPTLSQPDGLLPNEAAWANIPSEICVSDTGALLNLGPCSAIGNPAGSNTVNQNTSTNAAFGMYSAELDNDVKSGPWDIMSVDFRMGHLGTSIAQLFISPTSISEPGTLAVVSLGLFGLYRLRQRRQLRGLPDPKPSSRS